jgi:hypothetical protein
MLRFRLSRSLSRVHKASRFPFSTYGNWVAWTLAPLKDRTQEMTLLNF